MVRYTGTFGKDQNVAGQSLCHSHSVTFWSESRCRAQKFHNYFILAVMPPLMVRFTSGLYQHAACERVNGQSLVKDMKMP